MKTMREYQRLKGRSPLHTHTPTHPHTHTPTHPHTHTHCIQQVCNNTSTEYWLLIRHTGDAIILSKLLSGSSKHAVTVTCIRKKYQSCSAIYIMHICCHITNADENSMRQKASSLSTFYIRLLSRDEEYFFSESTIFRSCLDNGRQLFWLAMRCKFKCTT
jgi:hypothetical protein